MSRQPIRLLFALASVTILIAASASSLLAQGSPREDWGRVRYGALQIDVPGEFKIQRSFRPLFMIEGQEVYLNFITATNQPLGLFAWAGYHYSPCGMNYEMAKEILETYGGLNLPGIGIFDITASRDSAPHKTIRAPYREITARSKRTGRYYRIYFAFKPPECSANLSFIVVGFPENAIGNYDEVMSTIFASFRLK